MAVEPDDLALGCERHIVQFYQDDSDLVSLVTGFLVAGLRAGEVSIVVATAAHRSAFEVAIADLGIDLATVVENGSYVVLDADEVLSAVSHHGRPDPGRFDSRIGSLIDRASATGRSVRVFGEMVAILWDRGDPFGALTLEALWNDLGACRAFSLYCAYPLSAIAGAASLKAAKGVCDHHSSLVAPTTYPLTRSLPTCPGAGAECSSFFVPVPSANRAVRHFVVDTLSSWHQDDLVENATLVASELASNAVVHARSPFRVSVRQAESVVRLAVHDAGHAVPDLRNTAADVPGGRGMRIVSALSRTWGYEPVSDGKIVWAELDVVAHGGTMSRDHLPV
jgi:anti-sigma regulatory factor (Ser/Thr protein kinase)